MKCPKCGTDNPPGTFYCDECGWRIDMPFRPEKKRNPRVFALASCLVGAVGVVCLLLGVGIGALAFGAVALFLGGYSINLPKLLGLPEDKMVCVALSTVAILLGVVGFIFGLASLV